MQRDLEHMAATRHDLLIIGGGITGACIARDAAMRGLSVALVEKKDFSSATSSGSSKLVHGGLRYLANFELSLVRESLRERRTWEAIAPHMVTPVPFLVPLYGMASTIQLKIGLTLYDMLSFDRNRLDDPDKHMPRHKRLSREEALKHAPYLKKEGLTGAMIYYDCQTYAPERVGVECIGDAADNGAHVANYAQVDEILTEVDGAKRKVTGARVTDLLDGSTHEIKADLTINATGPWGDIVMALAEKGGKPSRGLIRSKGIHLITRKLTDNMALAVLPKGGGHFFVIPWRDHTIIGTTDTVFNGKPDELGVSEKDIADFIEIINTGLPGLNLTRDDVEHFYAGLRPLVDTNPNDEEKDSYGASRAAEIFDHGTEGLDGLLSALGGKWTTSRHLAEEVTDMAYEKLGQTPAKCTTAQTPVQGGEITRYSEFEAAALSRLPNMPRDVVCNLARNYGSRMDDVVDVAEHEGKPELLEPLSNISPTIGAQVLYSIRTEMARSLDDILQRRTGLGTLGHPGHDTLRRIADIAGDELGWDPGEKERQIAEAELRFTTRDDAA
ncbi:glycerol-3-phosphate dehydrogenase/oxidase [Pyruvatibacter sp. HU-CL02332]|uniref:glycerol-3-phosphate dehydrogenase/oxidase n=1 Tax=Pyruvatibacter sp. HU-CL02332 TaxID=3127650 RepID=UPI00310B2AEA